jgi:hypothetical protein
MFRTHCWLPIVTVAVATILPEARPASPVPPTPDPAVGFRQQIQSDWLRQEAVRPVEPLATTPGTVSREIDAAGACDGRKTGAWGFHTEFENQPWWQVDLGRCLGVERLVVYNRCDGCAPRTARMLVLVSDDGRTWRQVYQHNGKTFYGHSDGKPLVVALARTAARYVRLQLPGKSYFHLDEVEVYAAGEKGNVALRRPATQSSTSRWSGTHAVISQDVTIEAVRRAIDRGRRLAENLRAAGVDVDADQAALRAAENGLARLPANAVDARRQLYLDVRWTVRRLALRNPLLDFDSILFVKSAPTQFPHMSDQFYGWWSRPGGGVCVLSRFKSERPRIVELTADMPPGNFIRPELSYDGRRVLFAYARHYAHVADLQDKASKSGVPEDAFYHVFEMNLDGTGRRQLTHGRYDDFDARYLPSGEIVFLSTRKGQFLQASKTHTELTTQGDLADSYVRCGGNNYRPVPVFTLHVMDANGAHLRPISAFENFEWTPAVARDGRVLYTRWDYIDRFNGHFFSLWSTNPDGTNPQLVYGNYTVRPQVVCEAVPVPHSHKLVFTASAHHSIVGGSLVLLDRNRGTEGDGPIVRLTPEVPFPETEANIDCYYANPWPLSEEHFLVSWSDRRLPPHTRVDNPLQNPTNAGGLYLYDALGNLNLLYRDPEISSGNPIAIRARPRPTVYSGTVASHADSEGRFLLQDVYQGLPGVRRGSVKWLRVVAVPPKTQPHMNTPNLGVSREDPGKFLVGLAPVETDGSAYFRAPSGMAILFQAVDGDGLAVQTMRSLTYVGPGQTLACVGCHEARESTPVPQVRPPLAALREPSKLTAGPSGTWPLKYEELVQPVLDRACVSCHRSGSGNAPAARFDLTAARSYDSLLGYADKDLRTLAFERDRSAVGDCPARQSKLLALLKAPGGHAGVHLDRDGLDRLATWMDLYAQRQGHFSPEQETALRALREQFRGMLEGD